MVLSFDLIWFVFLCYFFDNQPRKPADQYNPSHVQVGRAHTLRSLPYRAMRTEMPCNPFDAECRANTALLLVVVWWWYGGGSGGGGGGAGGWLW